MSFDPSEFSEAMTGVFWDLDDCPIPNGGSIDSIYTAITLGLKNMGYNGSISIVAYSLAEQKKKDFDKLKIKLMNPGTSKQKVTMMFQDVYLWGIAHRDEPTNLMVITEDISHDRDFVSGLVSLSKRHNNILLAHPQNTSGQLLHTASSIWLWNSLSTGGCPLNEPSNEPSISSQVETPSQICSVCKKRPLRLSRKQKKKRRTKPSPST